MWLNIANFEKYFNFYFNKNEKVTIEIDLNAGFCFGVTNSIKKTEELLKNREEIYVLGELVHNEEELNRLKN